MTTLDATQLQLTRDEEHLRLLRIFYFITGAVTAAASLIPVLHLLVGIGMLAASGSQPPPKDAQVMAVVGGILVMVASVVIVLGMILAGLKFFAAVSLGKRKHRTATLVVAAISCLAIPYGTILGIMTILVLVRPTVIVMYDEPAS